MPTYKWDHTKFRNMTGPGDCDPPEPDELTDDDDNAEFEQQLMREHELAESERYWADCDDEDDRDPDEEAEAYEEWERDCYDPREDALAWGDQ